MRAVGVCLALWLGYQAFIFAYNYNSPFTWGVSWWTAYWVSERVSEDMAKHEGDEEYWVQVLKESDISAFQQPALGDLKTVLSGECLPPVFFYDGSYSCPIIRTGIGESLLFDGTIVVRNRREFWHFRQINAALVSLRDQESPAVVEWLAARSGVLPPRRLDPLIYFSLEGPPRVEPTSPFWDKTRDSWRNMGSAKNPVYRLLALQSAHHWCETAQELTRVYESAFREQNSIFHSMTLHFMRALTGKKPEDIQKYRAFSGMEEEEITSLFRGRWTDLVKQFVRLHPLDHDATEFHWQALVDIEKTLDYLAE